MDYLDFEAPIREIDEQIAKAKALQAESGVDMQESLAELEAKLAEA
ncbi:MAG TPA: acetyl-CoA carboxylase carboxyl transferase subunit alpha, partial [Cryomorphaceae bacterium]|nr:acetyl-CoA carboxylase carboxyl transferase subunit alpha [Cryomorphaceae bacterium]